MKRIIANLQSAFRFASLHALLLAACFLGISATSSNANTADFNNDGKADLLFFNKTTRILTVWFMDGSSFSNSMNITSEGNPVVAEPDWKVVGVGRFDPTTANRLCILWQKQADRVMAVWYLTNSTVLVGGDYLPNASPGWWAGAVGDFNNDGKSDIAFQDDVDGNKAIWLMNGLNILANPLPQTTAYFDYAPNWRLTGAGDFGDGNTPTSGTPDSKTDLLLTYYNPQNDNPGVNQAGIWFMDGLTRVNTKAIQYPGGPPFNTVPLGLPDWRAVATGKLDADGKTDVLFRDAVIGRHPIWHLSGCEFQSGNYAKAEPDPALKLYSQDWLQSTWRHKDLYPLISATAQGGPVKFTLTYLIKPFGTFGLTIRRRVAGGTWAPLVTAWPYNIYIDQDPTLQSGVRYEYEVMREGGIPSFVPARIFVCQNQPDTVMHSRGKVLVIVDSSVYSGILGGLNSFTNDLIGDGWSVVVKHDAPRHDDRSVACAPPYVPPYGKSLPDANVVNLANRNTVKGFVNQHSDAKGIILVGHVTVPYSGDTATDGHTNHVGAWVADAWYGHSGNGWTDGLNFRECTWFPENSNMAGEIAAGGMIATASSEFSSWEAVRAIDGLTVDPGWHNTSYTAPLEYLCVDLGASHTVSRVAYLPRQMNAQGNPYTDGSWNGVYKQFEIYVTDNQANWGAPVASGEWTWPNGQVRRDISFIPKQGRYVYFRRVTAYGWYAPAYPGFASADEVWVYKLVYELGGPKDGKFDNDYFYPPSEYTKSVGRIDFARLSSFGTSDGVTQAEKNLLNNYFTKDRAYRRKQIQFDNKAIALSTYDLTIYTDGIGNVPYDHAFRNASPLFGYGFDKILIGDAFHQKSDSYLWGFLAGPGGANLISYLRPEDYSPAEGPFLQHMSSEMVASQAKVGFYMLVGSYFGDWNLQDNFMRAVTAITSGGLTAAWMSPNYTKWQLHALALGDPIGDCVRQSLGDLIPNWSNPERWSSMLGDPTLRMNVVARPQTLSCPSGNLNWTAGESGCVYYVYHAPNMQSPFTVIAGPMSETTYYNSAFTSGVFMVRAVKSITTGSATFNNFSQGTFCPDPG